MGNEKDIRFWDRIAKKYSKSSISDQAGYEKTLSRTGELLKSGDRVLELGCGTGTTALKLAGNVESYLATDISPGMIAIANEKLSSESISALSFRAATADTIAVEATQFDAVLGFNYLHLVRDPQGALNHIRKLLVPGGLLITKTPCLGDMNPLIRYVMVPIMRAVGKAPFVSSFKAQTLSQLIEDAGFEIIATEGHASKGKDTRPYIVARS